MQDEAEVQWKRVRDRYASSVEAQGCCSEGACCPPGYSNEELKGIPEEAVLGLGSGNPVRAAQIREGETVVDLGSGGGIDVFLAARLVGPHGRAIGIDMTPEMVALARRAAARTGAENVEFHLGRIESLPLDDEIADVVVSNCVVNLSPDKPSVFREAFRVLRPGGRLVVSDIVQERDLALTDDDCGCVATALLRRVYVDTVRSAGFAGIEILSDEPWRTGSAGIEASAVTFVARKPAQEANA